MITEEVNMHRVVAAVIAAIIVACGWSMAAKAQDEPTYRAYLPYLRRDPTPSRTATATPTNTPIPTSTPVPQPTRAPFDCRQYLRHGDFEVDDGTWRTNSSDDGFRVRANILTRPHSGEWSLELHPDEDESVLVAHQPFDIPSKDKIVSARIVYFLLGHSLESFPTIDSYAAAITNDDPEEDEDIELIDVRFNQHAEPIWAGRVFDITGVLKSKGWRKIMVAYFAENDFSDNTWWNVDDVTLEICTRWPNAVELDTPSVAPPVAVDGASNTIARSFLRALQEDRGALTP